jgi:hypothetical protein
MRRRALVALVLGLACGPSRPVEDPIVLESFLGDFAQAFCHRVYSCCESMDVAAVSPGTDEEECTAQMTGFAKGNADFLLGFRGIVFDADNARRCLDVLRHGACTSIFEPHYGSIIPCQDLFPGTREAGEHCEDDQECLSGRCGGSCAAAPVPTCPSAEYVDRAANLCVARHGDGTTCNDTRECITGDCCSDAVCVARARDGELCGVPDRCIGTCGAGGFCRPGYCRGR